MKTNHKIFRTIGTMLLAATVLAGFTACETDPVEREGGKLPDGETVEGTFGILRSAASADNTVAVLLTAGEGEATQTLYFEQTRPAAAAASVTLRVDETLVAAFNTANGTACEALPTVNYAFPDGSTLSVAAGKQQSDPLRITLDADGLDAGTYLLPVTAAAGESDASQTVYYVVSVREPYTDPDGYDLHDGSDLFFVFYINTNDFQPLLAQDYILRKWLLIGGDLWMSMIGNIINLRTVTIQYDEPTGRALLDLGTDMTYVLNHASKYIWPLQEQGRKVCLSLEGGGTGLGFCNLSDEQIADFAAQVANVVKVYDLDGINLWDRNAGYGTVEGMPETNTTSYPKLVKAMREALGTDKLLTLTVYEEPTATFWDTEATGGIKVGEYLDYAWSGYNKYTELPQILDPWHPDESYVSAYTQKPIAGLDPSQFGCVNFPIYPGGTASVRDFTAIKNWVTAGYQPNRLIVFADIRAHLQDEYETQWDMPFKTCCEYMDPASRIYSTNILEGQWYTFNKGRLSMLPSGALGYGKWLKDW